MSIASPVCPSCGTPFAGKFCSNCGEKQVSHHDFTVGHYVEESVEGITHFDNKFIRTIRNLWKPGALTAHFEQGRKVRFMKPMQLFVICNILFFLFAGKSNVFSQKLGWFLGKPGPNAFFFSHVGLNPDMTRLSELFLEKMTGQSKAFILFFLPFYAAYTAILFWRQRKPFGLHLVFATHYFSFLLFFFTLFGIFIEIPYYRFASHYSTFYDSFAIVFNFTAITVYFVFAARRFFHVRWWWAIITGVGAGYLFILVVGLYRHLLFYNIVRTFH